MTRSRDIGPYILALVMLTPADCMLPCVAQCKHYSQHCTAIMCFSMESQMYDPISRLLVNYVQIPITTFVLTPMGVSVPSLDPIRPVIKSIVFFGALNIVLCRIFKIAGRYDIFDFLPAKITECRAFRGLSIKPNPIKIDQAVLRQKNLEVTLLIR